MIKRSRVSAFTMVEVIVSMAVISLMLVAALSAVGAARASERSMGDSSQGAALAADLLEEILARDFMDANSGVACGPEAGESAVGSRLSFDDVDDYHGLSDSPPRLRDGSVIAGAGATWARYVMVFHVARNNPNQTAIRPTGLKRIDIVVQRDGRQVAYLVALKAAAPKDQAAVAALE